MNHRNVKDILYEKLNLNRVIKFTGADSKMLEYEFNYSVIVSQRVDQRGIVIDYAYDAYGRPTLWQGDYDNILEGPSWYNNPYYFTGRRLDVIESGTWMIQYHRNRFYDYRTGRWLNQDPIGYQDGVNLYEYVKSNPVMYYDEYGLRCGRCWGERCCTEWKAGWQIMKYDSKELCVDAVLHDDFGFYMGNRFQDDDLNVILIIVGLLSGRDVGYGIATYGIYSYVAERFKVDVQVYLASDICFDMYCTDDRPADQITARHCIFDNFTACTCMTENGNEGFSYTGDIRGDWGDIDGVPDDCYQSVEYRSNTSRIPE